MRTQGFFDILACFSEEELKKFSLFLQSPYHNRTPKLSQFYDNLLQNRIAFTSGNFPYVEFYRKLYPDKIFKLSTIRNLISDLYYAALKFMELENFSADIRGRKKNLLNELNKKGLELLAKNIIKNTCSNNGNIDYSYFSFMQFLESYKYNISYMNSKISGSGSLRNELQPLENSAEYLVYFYICEMCSFYVNSRIYELNYNLKSGELLPEKLLNVLSIEKIKKLLPKTSPYRYVLKLYDSMVKLYSDFQNEKLYFTYKYDLEKFSKYLSNDEKNMHINNLISFCIYNRQKIESIGLKEELFDLYVLLLEKEYYMDSKTEYLPHELFRSILLEALRNKKYDWAWQFSEIYPSKLRPADRKNMKNLSGAYICFETGQLSESLKYLNKINTDFFIFKVDIKNLTLKIFYDLGYSEEAFNLIKSYKEYLRKNNLINKERKASYLSFVRFTEKLLKYSETRDKSELGYIKYRLSNHKSTAFKPWLTEKIMELEQGYKFTA